MRLEGPETDTTAIKVPCPSKTGALTDATPSSRSPIESAQPRRSWWRPSWLAAYLRHLGARPSTSATRRLRSTRGKPCLPTPSRWAGRPRSRRSCGARSRIARHRHTTAGRGRERRAGRSLRSSARVVRALGEPCREAGGCASQAQPAEGDAVPTRTHGRRPASGGRGPRVPGSSDALSGVSCRWPRRCRCRSSPPRSTAERTSSARSRVPTAVVGGRRSDSSAALGLPLATRVRSFTSMSNRMSSSVGTCYRPPGCSSIRNFVPDNGTP